MICFTLALLVISVVSGQHTYDRTDYVNEEPLLFDKFPEGFQWGAATSAHQIEGAYDADGKSLSIWDTWSATPGHILDGSTAKVACNSYYQYEEDVQLLKAMGVGYYRFSIAWTRILPDGTTGTLPDGTTGTVNEAGVQYYKNLIAALKAEGIEPVVTLYHWDLPQVLSDQGGLLNPQFVDWFVEYARVCFREFGDDVKQWITFNEPWIVTLLGYGYGSFPPGITGSGTNTYTTAHHLILAHAQAYRTYQSEFASTQNGLVGITCNLGYSEPSNLDDPTSVEAAERAIQFDLGWFAHPILVDGEYPQVMRDMIDSKSELQGFNESRLPTFTAEEKAIVAGSADFLGINFYSGGLVYWTGPSDINDISYDADKETGGYGDAAWYPSGSSWLSITAWAMRRTVAWIKREYGDIPIVITENGFSDKQGNLDDMHRIYYLKHYINQLLKGTLIDGANVIGYYAWSLMDNFEWGQGYTEKFGIHYVNFSDPALPRTAKESSKFLAQLISDNGFVEENMP